MKVQIIEIQKNSHNLKPGDILNLQEEYIFTDEQGKYLKIIDPHFKKILKVRIRCL